MQRLHDELMRKYDAYERWHHHPAHRAVHWLAFLAVAALAATLYISNIRSSFADEQVAPFNPPRTFPASQGKVVGVVPDHLLVKFKSSATSAQRGDIMARHDLKVKTEIQQIGVSVMKIGAGQNPVAIAKRLREEAGADIEFVELDMILSPSLIPNDPWFANWQKDKTQINAPAAWDVATGSSAQIIAIADTGVDCAHEDLSANCTAGWNFYDDNADTSDVFGHGTMVAGVAGAVGNNGVGVAGNAWQPKIMPLRVSAPNGTAAISAIAAAVAYAADHGVKVVNNSYQTGGSETITNAANYLRSKGGLLVVSEGNYGANTGYAANPGVISVSAVDASDTLYSWSSFGADVDLAAPGCTGATSVNHGGYSSFCGTSNAAPEVSGAVMLIWSVNPNFTPDQVQSILFSSAKDLGTAGWDASYGAGRIDAAAAVALAQQTSGGGTTPVASLRITSQQVIGTTATSATIAWTTDAPSTGIVRYGTSAAAMTLSAADTTLSMSHRLTITGLQKTTKYTFSVHAERDGATADGPTSSFRTKAK